MEGLRGIAQSRSWYHTIDLGDGLVTEGWFDLQPYVQQYGLPDRLDGLRALEVGTWDGFWAFELEKRGAEVVALDLEDEQALDWPPRRRPRKSSSEPRGAGFALAKAILGSRVERVVCSIYDADPGELGTFDLVFCGSVLIHLRDQYLALERMSGLCRGRLILAEEYDRVAQLCPVPMSRYLADRDGATVFWLPSVRTWKRMVWSAGFEHVTEHSRFDMHNRDRTFSVRHAVIHADKR